MSRSVWLLHCDIPNTPPPGHRGLGHGGSWHPRAWKGSGLSKDYLLFSLFFYYFFSFWLRITLGLYHHTISRFFFFPFTLSCFAWHCTGEDTLPSFPFVSSRVWLGEKEGGRIGGRKPPVGRGTRSSWEEGGPSTLLLHLDFSHCHSRRFLVSTFLFLFGSLMEGGRRGPDGRRRRGVYRWGGGFRGAGWDGIREGGNDLCNTVNLGVL